MKFSRVVDRIHRPALAAVAAVALAIVACAPGPPRIDGEPGAPPRPSTLWPVPPQARTPAPSPVPPTAPAATAALRKDSASASGAPLLSLTDVMDLALRNNPSTRQSWELARAGAEAYGASRGALFPTVNAGINLTGASSTLGTSALGGTQFNTGQTVDSMGAPSSRVAAGGSTRSQLSPSITLSYLVFDLGGRAATIETAKQRAIAVAVTRRAAEYPTYLPLGQYVQPTAIRKNVSGILKGPAFVDWNISVK